MFLIKENKMEKTAIKEILIRYFKIGIKFFLLFWLFYFVFKQFVE